MDGRVERTDATDTPVRDFSPERLPVRPSLPQSGSFPQFSDRNPYAGSYSRFGRYHRTGPPYLSREAASLTGAPAPFLADGTGLTRGEAQEAAPAPFLSGGTGRLLDAGLPSVPEFERSVSGGYESRLAEGVPAAQTGARLYPLLAAPGAPGYVPGPASAVFSKDAGISLRILPASAAYPPFGTDSGLVFRTEEETDPEENRLFDFMCLHELV